MFGVFALFWREIWDSSRSVIENFVFYGGTAKICDGHVRRCVALHNQIRGFDISMHNANTAEEGKSIKSLPKKDNSIIGADRE
jgi:hypothetical protein